MKQRSFAHILRPISSVERDFRRRAHLPSMGPRLRLLMVVGIALSCAVAACTQSSSTTSGGDDDSHTTTPLDGVSTTTDHDGGTSAVPDALAPPNDAGVDGSSDAGPTGPRACKKWVWNGRYDLPADGVCTLQGLCELSYTPVMNDLRHAWAGSKTDVWMNTRSCNCPISTCLMRLEARRERFSGPEGCSADTRRR